MINATVMFNLPMYADINTKNEIQKMIDGKETFNGLTLKAVVDEDGNKVESLEGIKSWMFKEDGTIVVTFGHHGEYFNYRPELQHMNLDGILRDFGVDPEEWRKHNA